MKKFSLSPRRKDFFTVRINIACFAFQSFLILKSGSPFIFYEGIKNLMDSFFFSRTSFQCFFFSLFIFFFFFLLFSQYFFYLFFYKEYSDLYLNCHLVLFCFFKRNIKNKSNVPFCKFLLICMLIILQLNFHLSFRFCIKF